MKLQLAWHRQRPSGTKWSAEFGAFLLRVSLSGDAGTEFSWRLSEVIPDAGGPWDLEMFRDSGTVPSLLEAKHACEKALREWVARRP